MEYVSPLSYYYPPTYQRKGSHCYQHLLVSLVSTIPACQHIKAGCIHCAILAFDIITSLQHDMNNLHCVCYLVLVCGLQDACVMIIGDTMLGLVLLFVCLLYSPLFCCYDGIFLQAMSVMTTVCCIPIASLGGAAIQFEYK